MSTYIVGLSGGIGSGKTSLAELFAARGITVIDTDCIARRLTEAGGDAMPAIIAEFGTQIADAGGALDRKGMRQRVFSDPAARQRLEAILHPLIASEAMKVCAEATSPYVIVAVPLLVEVGGWKERCDRVLVIDSEESDQISRVMARSGLAESEVRAILTTQASREQRLAVADDVVINASGLAELAARVDELHPIYLTFAQSKKLQAKC